MEGGGDGWIQSVLDSSGSNVAVECELMSMVRRAERMRDQVRCQWEDGWRIILRSDGRRLRRWSMMLMPGGDDGTGGRR